MDKRLQEYNELSDKFHLIPLNGKVPTEPDWQYYCENSRHFDLNDFKGRNAGIPCGPANGIIVIDMDDPEKFKASCKAKGRDLPPTRRHQTGTGNPHIIYRYPQNVKRYGNRSLKNDGFDIRGIGGQVVAPGSIHPDTGRPYKVLWDLEIEPAPQWLLDLAFQKPEQTTPQPLVNSSETFDIESLSMSFSIKNLIKNGTKKGDRSEAIGSVLSALIRARVSDQTIFQIFDQYPIGEKYLEKGRSKTKWLQDEINRSKGFNNKNIQQQSRGSILSELKEEFGQDKDIQFIWKYTIPKGQPIMFAGREGSGKTTILLQAANEIIETNPSGIVLWVSTEGTVVDTIHKALVLGLEDKGERFQIARKRDRSFKFSLENRSDYKEFDHILTGLPEILVVFIDSVRGMSKHSENDDILGKVMQSVNALVCDKHRSALVYLDHYKKGMTVDPLDKVSGSTAKTSAVRLVMGVEKKSVTTVHVKPTKNNFMGREIPELESVQVGDKIHIRELKQLTDQSLTNKCQLWLTDLISSEKEMFASDVYQQAEEEGFSSSILKYAKGKLPIGTKKDGQRWKWVWELSFDCYSHKQDSLSLDPLNL